MEPTFTPFGNITTSCCEIKKNPASQSATAGASVGVKFKTGQIPLPPPFDLFYVPFVGSVGLYVAGDLTIAGTVQYDEDNCTDKACFSGGPSVNITIEGGLLAKAGNSTANIGINGGAGVQVTVGCDAATYDVGLNAINLVAGYTSPFTGGAATLEIPLIPATRLGAQTISLK